MTSGCVRERPGGCSLAVRVAPRAGRTTIAGHRGGSLMVRVAAPPHEGAANAALIDTLADVLQVPKRAVTILRGAKSRDKLIGIEGLSPGVASSRLEAGLRTAPSARGR